MIVSALTRLFLDENENTKSGYRGSYNNNMIKTEEEIKKVSLPLVVVEDKTRVAAVGDASTTLVQERTNFVMPLHYPNYSKKVYEEMEERELDNLLAAYGFLHLLGNNSSFTGDLKSKKEFAMGAFLWPGSGNSDADLLLHEKSGEPANTTDHCYSYYSPITLLGFLSALLGFDQY